MIKRRILNLMAFCLLTAPVFSQDVAEKWLKASIGPSLLQRQDLIFSPFIHSDFSLFNGSIAYEKQKKTCQFFSLQYSGFESSLSEPYEYLLNGETHMAYPHSFTFVQLGYGTGWFLGKKEQKRPSIGISLAMDVQAMNYQYGRFSFFGYYSATSLGAWYQHVIRVSEKSTLKGNISIPLVSWIARSPYLVNDDEFIENTFSHNGLTTFIEYLADGHIATWDELQSVDIGLQYRYALSQRFSIGADYKFTFIHAALPEDLYSTQNNLHFAVDFKL